MAPGRLQPSKNLQYRMGIHESNEPLRAGVEMDVMATVWMMHLTHQQSNGVALTGDGCIGSTHCQGFRSGGLIRFDEVCKAKNPALRESGKNNVARGRSAGRTVHLLRDVLRHCSILLHSQLAARPARSFCLY